MLTMVAVLPEPPLLVPELATGAAAETAALRSACREAARRLAAAASSWIAVGADAGGRRTVAPDARGSFVGFGVDVVVGLAPWSTGAVDATMPLPLLVAGWARDGLDVAVRGELVDPEADQKTCSALGSAIAREDVGLLIVGDGAAKHSEKAPGYRDDRAGPFDDAVAAALRDADPPALTALDPELAAQLWASGRAPWQVLAGATGDTGWTGELLHYSRPFGVGYHVAVWEPCG